MKKTIFLFLFLLSTVINAQEKLKINVHTDFNGLGLERDFQIFKEAIAPLGHTVNAVDWKNNERSDADINVFFEMVRTEKIAWAPKNWFVPNPEWFVNNLGVLNKIDLILCRTKEVERIFTKLKRKTYYMGFTSIDCYNPNIKKDYTHVLHLAGGSRSKGTQIVLDTWKNNAHLPMLTLIAHSPWHSWKYPEQQDNLKLHQVRLPLDEVREIQNRCGIHLCPSESEGFGHYITEAMSTSAVVLTTDAPPMNEFITDKRCLIPFKSEGRDKLAVMYYVDQDGIKKIVTDISKLSEKDLQAIGTHNRSEYLRRKQDFYQKLKELIN